MLTHGCEKQRRLYRRCGSGAARTARAFPAHIFAVTSADAKTVRGAAALRYTAKGDSRLLFGGWCEPSSCGLWLSRGLVVRATRLCDGGYVGEASQRRLAHRYRIWSSD